MERNEFPQANLQNASFLFGDPFDTGEQGDSMPYFEIGDPDFEEGEVIEAGDLDLTEPFVALSGGSGLISRGTKKVADFAVAHKNTLIPIGTGVAGLGAGYAAGRYIQKKKNASHEKARLTKVYADQARAAKLMGKIPAKQAIQFINVKGAKLNGSPIVPQSAFVADSLKNILDRQAIDTPFLQETVQGVIAGADFVCTSVGIATPRFYGPLILQIGTNQLAGVPGSVISVTASLPHINGTLTIAADPIQLTYEPGFMIRLVIFPWQLVTTKPLPVVGRYLAGTNIVVTVSGLPTNSSVSLIIPGSEHKYVKLLRDSLMK